jgi:hypothetical protein
MQTEPSADTGGYNKLIRFVWRDNKNNLNFLAKEENGKKIY